MNLNRAMLAEDGFKGFVTVAELREGKLAVVPTEPGAYVVLGESDAQPRFLDVNPGGHFKGEDPSVASERLAAKWVPGAQLLYVGEGGDLRGRLADFLAFGRGRPVGHWGGRFIWQVAGAEQFLIGWQATASKQAAKALEGRLLEDFAAAYGCLPFANLRL